MAYAQIHTQALRHPKVHGLSDAAFRLWIAGLCYSQEHLTDGLIGRTALRVIGARAPAKAVSELVEVRLWESNGDGWHIHDYSRWNDTKADVERKRQQSLERQRKWRAARQDGSVSNASRDAPDTKRSEAQLSTPHSPPVGGRSGRRGRRGISHVTRFTCPHDPACESITACGQRAIAEARAAKKGSR